MPRLAQGGFSDATERRRGPLYFPLLVRSGGAETSIHALRLISSGLFDEYPKLRVILGHLGEGLPFAIWRVDHRISRMAILPKVKLPMSQYLRENFYFTTSGFFHAQALTDVMMEVGADRVLYSVDYPFEDMAEAATGSIRRSSANRTDRKSPGVMRRNCFTFRTRRNPPKVNTN